MAKKARSHAADSATGHIRTGGLVLRTGAGFCAVLTETGERVLVNMASKVRSRGRRVATTLVVIGDRVEIRLEPAGAGGVVERVLPRRNQLFRLAPGRNPMRDVLAANLDSLVIVQSLRVPNFNPARLDRFLAIAEQADIPASIVLNKADLDTAGEAPAIAAAYRAAGYPVVITSAKINQGLVQARNLITGISALIGPSGVGKSTILNHIRPDLHLRTSEVSESTGKGMHTTVVSELLPLGGEDYVADTPGLRSIGLVDLDRYEVASVFRELRPLIGACRFPDCLHLQEPGCAVRSAVDCGRVSEARYSSYRRLLQDVTDGYLQDWERES